MSNTISIAAAKRERVGKGGARETRRAGRVPAIIYGSDAEPTAVSVDGKELVKQVRGGGAANRSPEMPRSRSAI